MAKDKGKTGLSPQKKRNNGKQAVRRIRRKIYLNGSSQRKGRNVRGLLRTNFDAYSKLRIPPFDVEAAQKLVTSIERTRTAPPPEVNGVLMSELEKQKAGDKPHVLIPKTWTWDTLSVETLRTVLVFLRNSVRKDDDLCRNFRCTPLKPMKLDTREAPDDSDELIAELARRIAKNKEAMRLIAIMAFEKDFHERKQLKVISDIIESLNDEDASRRVVFNVCKEWVRSRNKR